ncbi:hypothetical protein L2Y94_10270 [Luteibacter aegosomatis]|uniref:hypothetical protein n=1 Tax=Luteibacter aegosomatis TaxID=2911537 RepID=UPI001FF885D6|nr:hypothetical protein [Luteibacter aegosomatis]UPG87714.1 hypothetical protein L2Y94_10270 [Luteibacter aegosomatis]
MRLKRQIILLACGGMAAASIALAMIVASGHVAQEWMSLVAFFLIGMIVTTVIGLPLLYVVDRWFHFTGRYIVGGALYGDIFWILLDAPIFPSDWHTFSTRWFWFDYAPPRIALFTTFGAVFGVVYTCVLMVLERSTNDHEV